MSACADFVPAKPGPVWAGMLCKNCGEKKSSHGAAAAASPAKTASSPAKTAAPAKTATPVKAPTAEVAKAATSKPTAPPSGKKTTDGVKLEDSNIANYGSSEHKDAKEKKANAEDEWKGAGQAPGIEIWRIEGFGVKKWPKDQYGKFFSGDAYIILNTYRVPDKNTFLFNLHFWLGTTCSQDEYGTAAFKTVELDDFLGGTPVQYREVQGYESSELMGLFPAFIIMEGGIDGAFNKVKPTEYRARLMQFCSPDGKAKNVRVTEVKMERASLNQGDVFLLDNGLELIQWNGPDANPVERRKAMETINHIKDDRNGRPKSRVLDGAQEDEVFWDLLGGIGPIKKAGTVAVPEAVSPKIYRISDASGSLQTDLIAEGQSEMKKSLLDNDDCFIVDQGNTVFVWVGSGATKAEKSASMQNAVNFVQSSGRPNHTPISRVLSGAESTAFNAVFGGASF